MLSHFMNGLIYKRRRRHKIAKNRITSLSQSSSKSLRRMTKYIGTSFAEIKIDPMGTQVFFGNGINGSVQGGTLGCGGSKKIAQSLVAKLLKNVL